MRPRDQIEVVGMDELLHYVCTEEVSGTAGGESPAFDVCGMGGGGVSKGGKGKGRAKERRGRTREGRRTVRI